MSRRDILTVVLSLLVFDRVNAATISVPVESHQAIDALPIRVDIDPQQLVQKQGNQKWSLTPSPKADNVLPVTVSVANPPEGYSPFKMTFDVPFYHLDTDLEFGAAVVNDDHYDDATDSLRDDSRAVEKMGPGDLILLNWRARRIFLGKYQELTSRKRTVPEQADLDAAFWYLETTRDLSVNPYVNLELDDMVRTAVTWAENNVAPGTNLSHMDPHTAGKLRDILDDLRQRDPVFFNRLIAKISAEMSASNPSSQLDACARTRTLAKTLAAAHGKDNGQFPNSLQNATNAALCAAKDIRRADKPIASALMVQARAEGDRLVAEISDARLFIGGLNKRSLQKTRQSWLTAIQYASDRLAELNQLLK